MTTKTWARSATCQPFAAGSVVAELQSFDAALVPGKDIPALWAQDVTNVAGIAVGWVYNGSAFAGPVAPAPTQAQLVADASAKQVALRDGGITVNVGTASTPVEIDVASDVNGRDLVAGNVQYIGLCSNSNQAAPTFNWINSNGAQLTLTSAQMMSVGLTLRSFVQATYDALGTILAAIAGGTITATAQIDAAAWPTTAY